MHLLRKTDDRTWGQGNGVGKLSLLMNSANETKVANLFAVWEWLLATLSQSPLLLLKHFPVDVCC